jgi:hypothetical protein
MEGKFAMKSFRWWMFRKNEFLVWTLLIFLVVIIHEALANVNFKSIDFFLGAGSSSSSAVCAS